MQPVNLLPSLEVEPDCKTRIIPNQQLLATVQWNGRFMNKVVKNLIWLVVAMLGAWAYVVLAVRRGEPVGALEAGHLGCPASACLHWGLRRDGQYLDPLMLVRPARVRLLPWPADPDSPTPELTTPELTQPASVG